MKILSFQSWRGALASALRVPAAMGLLFLCGCQTPTPVALPLAAREVTFYGAPAGALQRVKERLDGGDALLRPALNSLVAEADAALHTRPPAVTEKTLAPPSGDKHDYATLAPYFWPDPASSNGLPYIRHDGKSNPEARGKDSDRSRLGTMSHAVETLSLAYYFTGREAYAIHAAEFLRTWFLNPDTRMNPNLNFAQAIRGMNTGRAIGIIEGRNISDAADAAQLLRGSAAWTAADEAAFRKWLGEYLDWLLTSKPGKGEAAAKNNHGTFFDTQAMRLALILNRMDVAKKIAEETGRKRIAVQIEPDGRQPLELERTLSLSYSRFNLEALFKLATLCDYAGVDLWHFQTEDGRCLRKALDYLLAYAFPPGKPWPFKQIKEFDPIEFSRLLRQAAVVYREPRYEEMLRKFPKSSNKRFQLLFPPPQAGHGESGNRGPRA